MLASQVTSKSLLKINDNIHNTRNRLVSIGYADKTCIIDTVLLENGSMHEP